MDKIKFPSWQQLSNPALYNLALLVSVLITLACFVGSFSCVQSMAQTNTLGLLGNFLAITLALVVLVMLNFAGGLSGHLAGWVGEIVCIATLRAMVLSQASSIILLSLFIRLCRWLTSCMNQLSKGSFLGDWHCSASQNIPLVKLASPSKLPYRLYPISCILLN